MPDYNRRLDYTSHRYEFKDERHKLLPSDDAKMLRQIRSHRNLAGAMGFVSPVILDPFDASR